jgi:transposase
VSIVFGFSAFLLTTCPLGTTITCGTLSQKSSEHNCELLLRILLIGYLYGITGERKRVEELRLHLAWRWFTGLGFDQEMPHHSTFSKNRHGRFQESKLFEQLFEEIVRQCVAVGIARGEHLSVDGSFVEANAAKADIGINGYSPALKQPFRNVAAVFIALAPN